MQMNSVLYVSIKQDILTSYTPCHCQLSLRLPAILAPVNSANLTTRLFEAETIIVLDYWFMKHYEKIS